MVLQVAMTDLQPFENLIDNKSNNGYPEKTNERGNLEDRTTTFR